MPIEDFLYEETMEDGVDYDFYTIYSQNECDDPYYPPYTTDIGIYKSRENAIKRARDSFYRIAEEYTEPEDRKYGGVEGMYYIEGGYFDDEDVDEETKQKRYAKRSKKPLYIIYDKEHQAKVEARWKRMHGNFNTKSPSPPSSEGEGKKDEDMV